jgi:NAD(P)-dependent dehydrogenase (short-subunit alcohol dehydrogenase family)
MAGLVEGKVALITGAGSGIGRATALIFAREGARVIVNDVNADGGRETVDLIERQGGDAAFVAADVSRGADVEQLVTRCVEQYGRLDCAYNNAGIGSAGVPLHEEDDDYWDRVIATNLKGVWLCMRAELRQMLGQGGGAIVNTASVAGLIGITGSASYVAAKHGVVGLTRVAALENAQKGIRVNCVCPGLIRTPLVAGGIARDPSGTREQMLLASEPIGRYADPSEVGEAVVWLCSDRASFVTGTALTVDGAWTAR